LIELVKVLSGQYGACGVLVDEYDKPVVDAFDLFGQQVEEIATENLALLKAFFETIKSLGEMIRFSFVTGSSRLARASMFSGDNARKDISFEAHFDAICGFTEEELQPFLAQSSLQLDNIKKMYNGYQFGGNSRVYNPFGVINCFAKDKVDCYWIRSGSLASSILRFSNPNEIFEMINTLGEGENIIIQQSEVLMNFSLDILLQKKVPLVQLLLQAGYLSLRVENDIWSLCVPNEEVRMNAIPELFWLAMSNKIERNDLWATVSRAIHMGDMTLLYRTIHKLLARVGFPNSANESYYRSVLQVAFMAAKGIECQVECHDSHGKSDLVLRSKSCRIIIELKLMDPTKKTKEQIHQIAMKALLQARGYAIGQAADVIAGWVVNKETRTLFDLDEFGQECNQFEFMK